MIDARAGTLEPLRTLFTAGPVGQLSDADLLERFVSRGGIDAELAFEALVDRHGPMVLRVCRGILRDPHEADDAFQATFLVLAGKASRIGRRGALASWLYGVARRTAMKARTGGARRRRHERAGAATVESQPPPDDDRHELQAVLHEEIARLPEKYRAPIVLCHLEGMTREGASARLHCPESTVGVRLMRARERLRGRLTRRGFAPSAGLLLAGLAAETAAMEVPLRLAESTVRAAAGGGVVSTRAVSLAGEAARAMTLARLKTAALAVVMAGVVAAGVGVLAPRATPRGQVAGNGAAQDAGRAAAGTGARRQGTSPWKKTLPGGATIELIGVSSEPPGPKTWWAPDGAPLAEPPFDDMGIKLGDQKGRRSRVFAARVAGRGPAENHALRWEIPGSAGSGSTNPTWNGREPDPSLRAAAASLPADVNIQTVRVGVASGGWATVATATGEGRVAFSTTKGVIMFSQARTIPGVVAIVVADSYDDADVRIVAADLDGKEHAPGSSGSATSGPLRMQDLEFRLPREQIREFRFQSRPYEWAEFRGVALEPRTTGAKP